ncbi:hypothetical protein BJ165DRAFT_1613809 [Panaeolus papilionaceus]|nr:hypothetical protein BJ165DRAFT_1613809 [Panaeolus papilionaceus]
MALRDVKVNAVAFQADLGSYDEVRRLHQEVVEKMGHPDILFNNAGVGRVASIEDVAVDEFEQTWRVNVGSEYLLTQLCLTHMQEQEYGRIVFCSSVAAGNGGRIGPHYASSKSALHGLFHWIAMRYAPNGITCNAVAPETGMLSNPTEQQRTTIPVRRFGLPEDIAMIVEMLILNSYMTNKIIVADGGLEPTAF